MRVFIDHNSTTPILTETMEIMEPYITNMFFNPGGLQEDCNYIKEK